jgi:hypothetical protein
MSLVGHDRADLRCPWCNRQLYPPGFNNDDQVRCMGISCAGNKVMLSEVEWHAFINLANGESVIKKVTRILGKL